MDQPSLATSVILLLAAMSVLALAFFIALAMRIRRRRESFKPRGEVTLVMVVIEFFDTLGIGAFAPSIAYYKLRKLLPEAAIAPNLMVANCLSVFLQAAIFIRIIEVDATLLILSIGTAIIGALAGAALINRLPARVVQAALAAALLVAALIMTSGNLGLTPAGGTATALSGGTLVAALVASVLFGALMNIGVGYYAPSLITLSLLGLDPRAAFPIMMGACAFLMPSASFKLLKRDDLDSRIIASTFLASIPGVLIAAFVVKTLPLEALRWLVIAIVLYTVVLLVRRSRSAGRSLEVRDEAGEVPAVGPAADQR
jgi:uncharacterized membrane protein YfcA